MKTSDALSRAVAGVMPKVPAMPEAEPAWAPRSTSTPPVERATARAAQDRPGRWMTLRDVAAELSVSVRTVKRLTESDGFPQAVLFGASPRVAKSEFEAYVARKMQQRERRSA